MSSTGGSGTESEKARRALEQEEQQPRTSPTASQQQTGPAAVPETGGANRENGGNGGNGGGGNDDGKSDDPPGNGDRSGALGNTGSATRRSLDRALMMEQQAGAKFPTGSEAFDKFKFCELTGVETFFSWRRAFMEIMEAMDY